MTQPTLSQVRVIDPMLTSVARGYVAPTSRIANYLFPIVPVSVRAGRIMVFGGEDFLLANTRRAPGANTKRVQFNYGASNFALVDYSLEGSVPIELQQEASRGIGMDLKANAIKHVINIMGNEREKQAADLARNLANYGAGNKITLVGSSQWSDPDSDPLGDMYDGKEAVRSKIGVRPNFLELAPTVLSALRTHPKILDRLSTATDRPPATLAQLQALFEIDTIVEGEGVYTDGLGGPFQDMWGKDAILAYVTPRSMQEMGSPSFGYTYQLDGYPVVEEAYYGNNEKTWYFPYTDARQSVLVGPDAGFLFKNAVA